MQTTAQNVQSIRFWSWVLEVDWVNVWLLENGKFEAGFSVIEIKAHNWQLPPKKKLNEVKFTADLYEIDLTKLQWMDWYWELSSVTAGSSQTKTEISIGSWSWPKDEIIWLNDPNITDATIVVKNWVTDITSNINIVKNWDKTGIVNETWWVLSLENIKVTYTFTANTSKTLVLKDILKLISYHDIKFINKDENWKKFWIRIPKWYSTNAINLEFKADDATDSVMTLPIEFKAFPTNDNTMVEIYDEQWI